jgi:hypothetical protein
MQLSGARLHAIGIPIQEKRRTVVSERGTQLRLAVFGLMALLLPLSFISMQLRRGSDWTHAADSAQAYSSRGMQVVPYEGVQSPIPAGTVLLGVDGRTMEAWAQAVFRSDPDRPSWRPGQTRTYTVLLPGGETQILEITLGELPLRSILRTRWGVLAFAAVSQVIGAFILWRRPKDPAAQALFIWAFSGSHAYAWSFPIQVGDLVGAVGFWLSYIGTAIMWVIYFAAGLHMALVFPKPIQHLRRRSWAAVLIYFAALALFLLAIGLGRLRSENTVEWFQRWSLGADLVSTLSLAATLSVVLIRYRRRLSSQERIKVRWAVYGASISGSLGLCLWILAPRILGIQVMSANTLGLLMVIFPISLAVAIWRHQLFDIDLIIRRTLVYTVLTVLLVAIYSLSVVGLQTLFRSSLSDASPLIVVLSTLAATTLFSPIHSRVQNFIDRRFYRQKYDASRALSRFAESAQEQLNLHQLVGELRKVVVDTMQPSQVKVWLREERYADE